MAADPHSHQLGDPRAMRALAALLRKESDRLASRSSWLDRRAGRLKFEGPAADDLAQSMLLARRKTERAAGDLRDIANRLLSGAARVETDLADMERMRRTGAI